MHIEREGGGKGGCLMFVEPLASRNTKYIYKIYANILFISIAEMRI